MCRAGGGGGQLVGEEGGKGARGTRWGLGGPTLPGERQFHSWFAP